jgi:transposase-like protein
MFDYLITGENRITSSYTCPICGRSYQNEGSYRRHLETHPEALSSPTSSTSSSSSIPLWPCSVCSSVFTTEIGNIFIKKIKKIESKCKLMTSFDGLIN